MSEITKEIEKLSQVVHKYQVQQILPFLKESIRELYNHTKFINQLRKNSIKMAMGSSSVADQWRGTRKMEAMNITHSTIPSTINFPNNDGKIFA